MTADLLAAAEPPITLRDEIECIKRELKLRRKVYPRWIATQRMAEGYANREIAVMEAILRRLEAWP